MCTVEKKEEPFWQLMVKFVLEIVQKRLRWAIIVIISFIGVSAVTLFQPKVIKWISNGIIHFASVNDVIAALSTFAVLKFLQSFCEMMQSLGFARLNNCAQAHMYNVVFEKIHALHYAYFGKHSAFEIVDAMKSDISKMISVFDEASASMINNFFQLVFGLIGISFISARLAVLILLWLPVKVIVVRTFSKRREKNFEQYITGDNALHSFIGDQITNIIITKLWDSVGINMTKYADFLSELKDKYYQGVKIDAKHELVDVMCNTSIYIAVVIYGTTLIRQSVISVSGLIAVSACILSVIGSLSVMINIQYYFSGIKPAVKRLKRFLDEPEENNEGEYVTDYRAGVDNVVIEFRNVCFSYPDGEEILRNVSFQIKQGEKVAIVGNNGEGKSTIFKLICGLYTPNAGSIFVNGVNLKKIDVREIRKRIAVVPQRSYIFNSSIRSNIDVDGKHDLKAIQHVCEIVGLDDLIERLPGGYAYQVGPNGEGLSGGQRRKLIMARALLKQAELILLDEPFTGYDRKSVQTSCFNYFIGKTVIMITHDLNEGIDADRILRLKSHRIYE